MTGAQTMIYTAAVALTTMGIVSTIAGWVIPQPFIHGAVLSITIGAAFFLWLVFILWVSETRHAARTAERKRRASAVEYTELGKSLD